MVELVGPRYVIVDSGVVGFLIDDKLHLGMAF